jgi:predicted O-methyltransferase YrrM
LDTYPTDSTGSRPNPARVVAVRERLLEAGVVVARPDGQPRELFPVAIGREEGLALRDCVRREGARNTLEIGLGFAMATLFICEGVLANGAPVRHVAIDPYQDVVLPPDQTSFAGSGLAMLEDAGVRELVEFYAEESQIVLPRLLAEGRRFDFAFIDGNHRFESVFLDLVYAGRLLEDRHVVFVDDTQLPGIRKAIDFCVANLGWTIAADGAEGDAHEWMVLRTGDAAALRRPFAHFVDF